MIFSLVNFLYNFLYSEICFKDHLYSEANLYSKTTLQLRFTVTYGQN